MVLFVDDDDSKLNKQMRGVQISGPITNIPDLIDQYDVKEVIIAIASLDKTRLRGNHRNCFHKTSQN